jgi:hypothetical protein
MAVEAAMAFFDVIRQQELGRLRLCADDCSDLLVDLSKNRSRRFAARPARAESTPPTSEPAKPDPKSLSHLRHRTCLDATGKFPRERCVNQMHRSIFHGTVA